MGKRQHRRRVGHAKVDPANLAIDFYPGDTIDSLPADGTWLGKVAFVEREGTNSINAPGSDRRATVAVDTLLFGSSGVIGYVNVCLQPVWRADTDGGAFLCQALTAAISSAMSQQPDKAWNLVHAWVAMAARYDDRELDDVRRHIASAHLPGFGYRDESEMGRRAMLDLVPDLVLNTLITTRDHGRRHTVTPTSEASDD